MTTQSTALATTFQYHATIISSDEEVQRMSIQRERISLDSRTSSTCDSYLLNPNHVTYDFHTVEIVELERRFNTKQDIGLTSHDATKKLRENGANVFSNRNYRWILDVIGYYFGGICLLLWPAFVLSILAYQPFGAPKPDPTNLGVAGVILIVIIFQGSFGLIQEYSSSKVMKSFNSFMPQNTTVVRDGKEVSLAISTLVTGDIVKLEPGVRVPADLRLLSIQNLKLDASMLTGEAEPVKCTLHSTDDIHTSTRNLAFMGCTVKEGTGFGMVVSTGNNTVMGQVAKLAYTTSHGTSTLRKESVRMVVIISVIAVLTGIFFVIYWAAFLRVRYPEFMTASAMIATVIGLIIAFVPEGLPLAMSLTLTFTALNMRRKQVLVKKLSTVETLGCVNVITSDKTGTLTRNEMHVSELFVGLQSMSAKASVSAYESNDESIVEMIRCLTLCNQAFYRTETSDNSFDIRRPIVGNSSDVAFLDYCSDFVNVTNVRTRYTKLAEVPFNSRNKYMTTIVQEDENTSMLFMKGAAEVVLKKCTNILLASGTTCPLTDTMNDDIKLHIEQYAKEGKRVFAAAKLQLNTEIMPSTYFDSGIDFPTEELTFIGLVALIDPPRTDVLDTLVTLRKAGIKMTIVTGDHPSTAIYIARSLGIISNHIPEVTFANANVLDPDQNAPIAILGEQIACLTNDQWKAIKDREVVFARTTPEQKLMVVKAYQRMGCIVAATGDGTNDAPALKQANVGIALGSGSEIAKEAADMILLDNSFNSIAIGVRHGRLAFDNLRKIVTYVLPAGNWAEMIPIFLSAFMGTPVPLSPFLMIYICVGTDVGPSLALVTEPAEGDTMTRKPRVETKEKLVDIWLFAKAFLFLGSIECIGALTMFFVYFYWYAQLAPTDLFFTFDAWSDGYKGHTMNELNEFLYTGQSIYFIALVMIQIGQVLTTRLSRNNFYQQGWVWKNPNLLIGILIEIILAVAIIYIPILNIAFKTRQPPVQFWFMPLVFSLLMFVMNEVWKFIQRARRIVMRREADVVL